jgi:hypothetical protein
MKELVGTEVYGVFVNEDKTAISFGTSNGYKTYGVEGDCCSFSWIEHLSGLEQLVVAYVNNVEDISMSDLETDPNNPDEYIRVYGVKIHTNKGYALLEYRNSSNGYYGGYLTYQGDVRLPVYVGENF